MYLSRVWFPHSAAAGFELPSAVSAHPMIGRARGTQASHCDSSPSHDAGATPASLLFTECHARLYPPSYRSRPVFWPTLKPHWFGALWQEHRLGSERRSHLLARSKARQHHYTLSARGCLPSHTCAIGFHLPSISGRRQGSQANKRWRGRRTHPAT